MKRWTLLWIVGLVLLGSGWLLAQESITLTTYYPAPYGVYQQLRSTEDTFLSYTSGVVGVGTTISRAHNACIAWQRGQADGDRVV